MYLNQIAQGLVPKDDYLGWFDGLGEDQKKGVLYQLGFMTGQASAAGYHVPDAVTLSGLKQTFTPCVLLLNATGTEPKSSRLLAGAISKAIGLPEDEWAKTFQLFLAVFRVADLERQSREGGPCERHWWHQDSSDPRVVAEIVRYRGEWPRTK